MSKRKTTEEETWELGDRVAEFIIYFVQVICFLLAIICFVILYKDARADEFPDALKDSTQTYVCYPIEQTDEGPVCRLSLGWIVTWGMAVEWQIDEKPLWIKFRNPKDGRETLFPPPRDKYACTVVGTRPSPEYCATVEHNMVKMNVEVQNPAGKDEEKE